MSGMGRDTFDVDVVIPTIGRPDLATTLRSLDVARGPRPSSVVVVDDRPTPAEPLVLPLLATLSPEVVASGGRGPAAARNSGWLRGRARWVAFLDDDVAPDRDWWSAVAADLRAADSYAAGADATGARVGAVTGRVVVPRPPDRAPTDAERQVIALEGARWITADMAVRRDVLRCIGGFDERFRRAYREDSDLALRIVGAGWTIAAGRRSVVHPVRTGSCWTSVRAQRGNADDALMRRRHGPEWRQRCGAPRGRLRRHIAVTACWIGAVVGLASDRRRIAALAAGAVGAATGAFWWERVRSGPRSAREWMRMTVSSALIPVVATWWAVIGACRCRTARPIRASRPAPSSPALVLFDRDGTLVHDVPYNGDPLRVRPIDGAAAAIDRLRRAGVKVGIVTNQSGVARGILGDGDVQAVNRRVAELLGPFDVVLVCPHGPGDRCRCRKPAPGMVLAATRSLGVDPSACAVVGDIGADVEAALAAGARGILVPTTVTRLAEIRDAPEVAIDLAEAVDALLGTARPLTSVAQGAGA